MFNKSMIDLIRGASKVGSDSFPETLKVSFFINTPLSFSAMYGVIKHFFEEDTRMKFIILGSDYAPTLLNAIGADQLPVFLGGTCSCIEYGGDCLRSDKGPW
jgi:CRAL/TRIO domain